MSKIKWAFLPLHEGESIWIIGLLVSCSSHFTSQKQGLTSIKLDAFVFVDSTFKKLNNKQNSSKTPNIHNLCLLCMIFSYIVILCFRDFSGEH